MLAADHHFRARLPAPVYDLALRLGVKPGDNRSTVRLTQAGRMKRSLDVDAWMTFTATQTISTRVCEFDWRARTGLLGIVSARDALENGEGRFDIMALGFIPVARTKNTPALVRGELMRYLAELPWSPDAILLNAGLRWRVDGPDTLSVSAGAEDTASEVVLSLDRAGRIAGAFAPDRPRSASAPTLPTPWHGRFAVETMPSLAPSTAARSQPIRSTRWFSVWSCKRLIGTSWSDYAVVENRVVA